MELGHWVIGLGHIVLVFDLVLIFNMQLLSSSHVQTLTPPHWQCASSFVEFVYTQLY